MIAMDTQSETKPLIGFAASTEYPVKGFGIRAANGYVRRASSEQQPRLMSRLMSRLMPRPPSGPPRPLQRLQRERSLAYAKLFSITPKRCDYSPLLFIFSIWKDYLRLTAPVASHGIRVSMKTLSQSASLKMRMPYRPMSS